MKAAQVAQNKMLRMLDGVSLKEHITSSSLLLKYSLPSVNQLAGEIKLVEAWKATHIDSYPFKLEECHANRQVLDRSVRPTTTRKWKDYASSKAARESISIDCAKLWNNAPGEIIIALNLSCAKREIKKYCKSIEL